MPTVTLNGEPDWSGDVSTSSYTTTAQQSSPVVARRDSKRGHHRRTSSSFMVVEQVEETPDQLVDQSIGPNANAEWVNMKGRCAG